ncbi:hypothetical protein [Sutcliffiella horikoshii]|uniref:hypothetical protein n=1 Tax=Sutcliffiella horikoshii TaxID=79883 RepID=UPI00384C1847
MLISLSAGFFVFSFWRVGADDDRIIGKEEVLSLERQNGAKTEEEEEGLSSYSKNDDKLEKKKLTLSLFRIHPQ